MRNYRLQLPKSSAWKISLHRNTANLLGGGIESINFTTTKLPPPPPPGKTFDNKCPTLGSLWPCYPFVSARFSSPIKKGEEKKETWSLFFLLFPTAKNLDQALTIETNRPTVVCGRFPGSHGYFVCALGLHDPSFSSWGYFGFEPSRMLVVFLIWGHFLSLLIGCSYCLVHNQICIVIMKYVISKAFG